MVLLIYALTAPLHRLNISSESICCRTAGKIVRGIGGNYTLQVHKGDRLVVNAYGTSKDFGVIAMVKFPDGTQDGNKGTPSVAAVIKKSGICTIQVGPNMMMNISTTGTYELEVVRYHSS